MVLPVGTGAITLPPESRSLAAVITGAAGTVVSTVKPAAPECGPSVPPGTLSVTVIACVALDRSVVGVNVHLPSGLILVDPIGVAPSYTVMMSPAGPVPLICGFASAVVPPATIGRPWSSVMIGVGGV